MPDKARLRYLLTQYRMLRAELLNQSTLQQQILTVTITALAALLTIAFETKNGLIPLTFPLLALFLALAWASNQRSITRIARFLREELEEELIKTGVLPEKLAWEHYVRASRAKRGYLSFQVVSTRGLFSIGSLVCIAVGAYFAHLETAVLPLSQGSAPSQNDLVVLGFIALDVLVTLLTATTLRRIR
jgi:ABC-type branched-subunit amino acid transport system permease subunit